MSINLTREQFNDLITKNKKIGEGTDGTCYRLGKKVYKIYHTSQSHKFTFDIELDSSGVRLHNGKNNNVVRLNDIKKIEYTDQDEIRLGTESGLIKAINRGTHIAGSNLPSDIIYVHGKVRGCVYPYYKHVNSIYKAYRKNLKTRLKICMSLYNKVKELVDNNIYPIDLAQKGKEKLFDKSRCNVFLSHKNEPIIIDLDGKSALYTENYNRRYEEMTSNSLITLLFEIITREDIQEDLEEEDIDTIKFYLSNTGLSQELIERFLDGNMTMKDVNKSLEEVNNKFVKKIK